MATDIERLRRDYPLSDIVAQYGVNLQRDGHEWIACCPFHEEDTPSFTVFPGKDGTQRYHCFGCGEKGDVLDFVGAIKGVDLKEAIKILGGETDRPNVGPIKVQRHDVYAGIEIVATDLAIEVGKRARLYNPKRAGHEWEWGNFTPEMVFPYRRDDGSLFGYVLRRSMKDGGKETPMVMRVRLPSGEECWSRFPFPKPRPLYGLDALRDGQVIVVEGEKCRDAMARATGRCVVSWAGGTQGVKHTDWKPLAGRSVVVWPDADEPGLATADVIAAAVSAHKATPRVLDVMGGRRP